MASQEQIDVLLYGLGAIGSFYAFILSRNQRVRLAVVARSNYDAVAANGLTINSQNHGHHIAKPHRVVKTAAEAGVTFDYVVCAHKAIDQNAAVEQIAPAVDEKKTTIVIIQNGVGNEEPFRQKFPDVTILSCVTWVGARQTEPGIINHTKSEDMQMGLFPSINGDKETEKQRLDGFAALLREGQTVFQVVPNVQVQRWEKVVWNAAWNPLTTLTMMTVQEWLASCNDATPMTHRLMREVIEVGRKCHVPLEYDLADRLVAKVLAMGPVNSSMQADYKNGQPMEVEIILGYPVRKGRELGIATPTLETIYTILTAINGRLIRDAKK